MTEVAKLVDQQHAHLAVLKQIILKEKGALLTKTPICCCHSQMKNHNASKRLRPMMNCWPTIATNLSSRSNLTLAIKWQKLSWHWSNAKS